MTKAGGRLTRWPRGPFAASCCNYPILFIGCIDFWYILLCYDDCK